MRRIVAMMAMAGSGLAACSAQPAGTPTPVHQQPTPPAVVAEAPWVRTTEGAADATMTGLFVTLSNPGDKDVTLRSASTDASEHTEIHEMVPGADGRKTMQQAKDGVKVPAGGHLHLKPGSYHIMLMQLRKPLAIGDQVHATLVFSDATKLQISAPVKKFVEEEDHYHPSMTPGGSGTPGATIPAAATPMPGTGTTSATANG